MVKGSLRYIPKDVAKECEEIMKEYDIKDYGESLRKMAGRSMAYRELKYHLGVKKK